MQEQWKPISGYESHYEVSSSGNVRAKERVVSDRKIAKRVFKARPIKPWVITSTGYLAVSLSKQGNVEKFTVHSLVAEHFCHKPSDAECVNHIDGNRQNNSAENLEWTTYAWNNKHAYGELGRKAPRTAEAGKGHASYKGAIEGTCIETGRKIVMHGRKNILEHGFSSQSVYACCLGKMQSHRGFTFKRLMK